MSIQPMEMVRTVIGDGPANRMLRAGYVVISATVMESPMSTAQEKHTVTVYVMGLPKLEITVNVPLVQAEIQEAIQDGVQAGFTTMEETSSVKSDAGSTTEPEPVISASQRRRLAAQYPESHPEPSPSDSGKAGTKVLIGYNETDPIEGPKSRPSSGIAGIKEL